MPITNGRIKRSPYLVFCRIRPGHLPLQVDIPVMLYPIGEMLLKEIIPASLQQHRLK